MSSNLDSAEKHPAVVIGPPYGGVKEQGPGVYANELAQRGFVVLTFDPSFNGESAYEAVTSPKELLIVPEANHVDLYDEVNKIPFDKLENFLKENLK